MSHTLTVAYAKEHAKEAEAFIQAVANEFSTLGFERIDLNDKNAPMPIGAVVALLFDNQFAADGNRASWIAEWDKQRATTPLLPIALDQNHGRPPAPIKGLKSRFAKSDKAEILRSIGAMLGLSLRPGKNKIFVSYRSADGSKSAEKIYNYLKTCGYAAWLDEGRDSDNNPNLETGDDVQEEIETNLAEANALILVDTPQAPDSDWIRIELAAAVGKLIPIYPVVLHDSSEETSASRFRVLQGLHRRVCIESSDEQGQLIFSDDHLQKIVDNVEEYILRVYRNRVVQPRELERWFTEHKWEFGVNALRSHLHNGRVGKIPNVFSLLACCSFEDVIFTPSLHAFADDIQFLSQNKQAFTRNLFLYPGATQKSADIEHVMTKEVPDLVTLNALLLSYNEAVARISAMSGGYYA